MLSFILTDTPKENNPDESHNAKLLKKNNRQKVKEVKREVFASKKVDVDCSDSGTKDLSDGTFYDESSQYDVNEEISLFNDNLKVGVGQRKKINLSSQMLWM